MSGTGPVAGHERVSDSPRRVVKEIAAVLHQKHRRRKRTSVMPCASDKPKSQFLTGQAEALLIHLRRFGCPRWFPVTAPSTSYVIELRDTGYLRLVDDSDGEPVRLLRVEGLS
jgi:hypothetical protein